MRWPILLSSSTTRFLRFTFLPFQTHSSSHNNFSTLNPNPIVNPTIVRETLTSFNNDWKRAIEFFNWVETEFKFQHSTETYNLILDILGKFFEFQQCWNLIHRMRNNPYSFPNHTTFRVMFKRYVSAHCIDDAVVTFQRLNEFNLKDETSFINLIDALCENKHVIEAQDLVFGTKKTSNLSWNVYGFDVIGGVVSSNNTKIYNILLRGWYKLGWWRKCWEFWDEMDIKGVQKDLHSYSIYMDILSKGGKPWKAVKLFKEMKRKGIKSDVVVYNIVIRAIGVSQGVDFSIRLFREMKDLGLNPTVVTYNTIIRFLCSSYRYKEALTLLRTMRHNGCSPNAVSYQCFFASVEKPKLIIDLFDGMIESGVRPTTDTCVMLLKKFARWGFLRLVFLVWNKMEKLGCSPDASAYNALIDALVEKGMIDMARKYDEEMLAKGLSPKPRKELGTMLLGGESDEE
ncbi:unnamed protein product [Trifolium pratense]|uniref:Uncharacterized protein n=1 Tax=Trifolium pratense TaxID=57577 RepID=A0ACB0K389_TRIPR|nr:unnamed protein product [Trifolium pratense]